MESTNLLHGSGEGLKSTENTEIQKDKEHEATDFEYVSKTDFTNEPEVLLAPKPVIVNDFNLDSFTQPLVDNSDVPKGTEFFHNFESSPTNEPTLIDTPSLSSANFISAEVGAIERPVSPYTSPLSDEVKSRSVADDADIFVPPSEDIDDMIVEKTLVSGFEEDRTPERPISAEPPRVTPEPLVTPPEPNLPLPTQAENIIEIRTPPKEEKPTKLVESFEESASDEISEPMQTFCKMGLDAWFNPDRLHPKVVELVYWRDPKKSGIVFGSGLGVLLSLSFMSLISVIAYLSLLLLTGTICFRIYKNVLQAVQKTSDGHPFKDILDLDLTLPQDKVREVTDVSVAHLNAAALELRRLFLVEDLVDSIKFGVLLWCLTYLGSWFNGMTLIIIAFVSMFTLPKIYENNKSQIDQNLDIVRAKLADISAKVKAAVPIGKKPVVEEKKEQ